MFCRACGAQMKENAQYCPRCGAKKMQTDTTWRVAKPPQKATPPASLRGSAGNKTARSPGASGRGARPGKGRGRASSSALLPVLCIALALAAAVAAVLLILFVPKQTDEPPESTPKRQVQTETAYVTARPETTPSPVNETAVPSPVPTPVATARPTAAPTQTPVQVQTPRPTQTSAVTEVEAMYIVRDPADTYANMRSGPGTQYDVVFTIPNGANVGTVDGKTSNGWYYVAYCDAVGWVTGAFVYDMKTTVRDGNDTYVNLRSGAGTSYSVLTTIPNGSQVEQLGEYDSNGWCRVVYNGYTGWVYAQFLEN